MVFNRGNKLCKASLFINNTNIENVKSYKYLGFTIGAKNCSLINTMTDLSIKAKRAIFALNNKIKISLLPPRLAIQIFMTQIVPILLYRAEVWGPYLNFDFTKWEKSETEKTQTQFLKRVLGCNIQRANLTSRAEVGCRPLLIDIIRKSKLYIEHLETNKGLLANSALLFEQSINDECNIYQLVRNFAPNDVNNINNNINAITKQNVKIQSFEYYEQIWKNEVIKLSQAESFSLYKNSTKLEKYLILTKNQKHRMAISRFRLSCHPLMIEKGRHQTHP